MKANKESLNFIANKDILCPKCSNPSIIINNVNENILINNTKEFIKFNCKKCMIDFCYILCIFCNSKIYMKIHPKNIKYNGINGFNISCPYKYCEKVFYFTECIKCKRSQKHRKFLKEGSIIKCLYNDCKCEYIQVNCPIKYCTDLISVEKPKIFTNFPSGMMTLHKKEIEILYQKINCYYCSRPIVFGSTTSHKNKYIDCQKVVCPYNDCNKTFNRIICPHCYNEIYVNDGWYAMGSQIKCNICRKEFGKILCVSCGKLNVCDGAYFKSGQIKCGFPNCSKENYVINCIYCRKLNIFNKEIPVNGQKIKCGYCKNSFNEVLCPFCRLINPFPLADFSFGKVYKCKYLTCLKKFQFLICPNCLIYSFIKESPEGKKFKCDECNVSFMNWGCPFCKSTIMDKNTSLNQGQMIKCPSQKCGKIYSFVRCSNCQKLIFSKENENISGMSVICPYQGCGGYTLLIKCPLCQMRTIYSGQTESINEGKNISCPKCKGKFKFKRDNTLYNNNLSILEEIQGETIDFGIGEIDENFLMKKDLFHNSYGIYATVLKSELSTEKSSYMVSYDINNYKPLDVCIVCNNNLRESIFYPCGHRCACYNCALIFFEVNKKCPKCKKEAKCIIKKIFE